MKKKILLTLLVVMTLVCLFTVAVSAEDKIVPSTSNAYGELTTFDEAIGNTGISNLKDDGTIARTVLTDGNGNYYTIPTVYTLTESPKNSNGKVGEMFLLSFTEISTKLGFTVSKNSIVRIEFPSDIAFICQNNESLSGCANMVECQVNDGLRIWEDKQLKVFTNCPSLTTIDISGMVLEYDDCTFAMFEKCTNLVSVKLPDAYKSNGKAIDYNLNYMFGECPNLRTIENFDGLIEGVNAIDRATFKNCNVLYNATGFIENGIVTIPSTITSIGYEAFAGAKAIKSISFPATLTSIEQLAFNNCTSLLFVDFNDNKNEFNVDRYGQFMGCTSLLAVSLPDNFKFISNQMFKGCTALKAVCLPKNLETFATNGWGDDPFNGCTNLYFVQEPFEVVDENGNFYTATTFVQPSKPDVYYMPESLSALCTNKTSGKCFTGSYNLNPYIVFGTNVTRTTLGDGVFFECGNNGTMGSGVTAVFLGNMEQLKVHPRDNRNKGVKYVFANENDKSFNDVTISSNYSGYYALNDKTEGFYFCHSNSYYLFDGVKFTGTYTNDTLTKIEGAIHFYVVEKETAPTCTKPGVRGYVCFCEAVDETHSEVIEALGHKASETIIDKYFIKNVDGSYNYFENMVKLCECTVCNENAEFEIADTALFITNKGYSFSETDASSFSYTLHVNVEAVKAYLLENATFKYGVVVSANIAKAPIELVDGAINKNASQTVIVELQGSTTVYEYVMTKLTFAEDYQASQLYCQAYAVEDDTVSYISPEKTSISAEVISHAILVEKYESKEDLEKVA